MVVFATREMEVNLCWLLAFEQSQLETWDWPQSKGLPPYILLHMRFVKIGCEITELCAVKAEVVMAHLRGIGVGVKIS